MGLGSLLTATRKNEALTFGQLVHDGVDLLFQELYLALWQMG
jgi:hypothetical protein